MKLFLYPIVYLILFEGAVEQVELLNEQRARFLLELNFLETK